MSAQLLPKSSLTAWERWELASLEESKPAAPVVSVPETGQEPEPAAAVYSEAQIAQLREKARRDGETAGRAAGYEAGLGEGRLAGHEEGYREGLAKGHAEGLENGRADAEALGRQQADALMAATKELDARINGLGPAIASEVLALSIEIARQVIRQTVAHQPEVLLGVIREALTQLPLQQAAIHLHPDDAALARRLGGEEFAHAGHRIREDPKLQRGDVAIECGGSHLDATLSTRWSRVVAALGQDTPWLTADEK